MAAKEIPAAMRQVKALELLSRRTFGPDGMCRTCGTSRDTHAFSWGPNHELQGIINIVGDVCTPIASKAELRRLGL